MVSEVSDILEGGRPPVPPASEEHSIAPASQFPFFLQRQMKLQVCTERPKQCGLSVGSFHPRGRHLSQHQWKEIRT